MKPEKCAIGWEKYETYILALKNAGFSTYEIPKTALLQMGRQRFIRGSELRHTCFCKYNGRGKSCPHCRDTCNCFQYLRMAYFRTTDSKLMIIEETVKVKDFDNRTFVDIVVYAENQKSRPNPNGRELI